MKFSKKLVIAAAAPLFALSGCYIVPMDATGRPIFGPIEPYAVQSSTPPAAPAAVQQQAAANQQTAPQAAGRTAPPAVLQVRLYPANDVATETGVLNATVTNMMNGKGRFNLNYRGEVLSGEATRTSSDARKGVASAMGTNGSFMSCEYQMSSPFQGAGECTLSNGARYQAHIGN